LNAKWQHQQVAVPGIAQITSTPLVARTFSKATKPKKARYRPIDAQASLAAA
jgi:hypothetical protein